MKFLEATDLSLEYQTSQGPLRAVDGVSFSIDEPGQTLGIIGESGSGKTSMVSVLTRVFARNVGAVGGRVVINGRDITALSLEEYRKTVRWNQISVVFQGAMNSFNPVIQIGLQVAERLLIDRRMDRKEALVEVERLFDLVGLAPDAVRLYPHELSGGMKQRAAIASALSLNPSLVILDEPTSALDVSVQAQIMNLLKTLKWERQLSYIFITHDIALAADLADTVAVVHAGELREFGPADTVLTTPKDPYTERLLSSVPRLHGPDRPGFLTGAPPDPFARPAGCRFADRCPRAFSLCTVSPPPLVDVGPVHTARCWLHVDESQRPAVDASPPGAAIPPAAAAAPLSNAAPPRDASSPATAAPSDATPLVRVRDLRVSFARRKGLFRKGEVRAVDGVSFTLGRGETLAIVGESGSGKTTLGRALLSLVPVAGGTIEFDGDDLLAFDKAALKAYRRRAQAVFQDPYSSNSPFMSIYDQIEEPLIVHQTGERSGRDRVVIDALERVRLTPAREVSTKFPHTLSGGQRQRVCIARALVLDPEFIVADEPVSMIDASSRVEILYLLRDLQRQGTAFLYITHDIASARHFSDRTIVMYLGTAVEMGPSPSVIDEPLHPYTQGLIDAVPEPDPTNRTRLRPVIPGEPPTAASTPSGCPFHTRCPRAIAGTCESIRPELKEIKPDHYVACHLY